MDNSFSMPVSHVLTKKSASESISLLIMRHDFGSSSLEDARLRAQIEWDPTDNLEYTGHL